MGEIRRVGIYGVGHFGYAMLQHLDSKASDSLSLRAFDRNAEVRESIEKNRRHPIHKSKSRLSKSVQVVHTPSELVDELELLILAVTSSSTREVIASITQSKWKGSLILVNTAKALDSATGMRLSEVIGQAISESGHECSYAAVSGGTIASELLEGHPLGITLAASDADVLNRAAPVFASPNLWVQMSSDLVGVELAGAMKNVIAICAGMANGLGVARGAETHLICRLAEEVEEFCVHCYGANNETFRIGSQCWGSDLWLSCTGETRNRAFGRLVGQGRSIDSANETMSEHHRTIEGVQTLQALPVIIKRFPDKLPLLQIAHRIIMHEDSPTKLFDAIMTEGQF